MTSKVLCSMLLAVVLAQACGNANMMVARDVRIEDPHSAGKERGPATTQGEMQAAVERFTGTFVDGVADAIGPLTRTGTIEHRREALRLAVVYASSALDIATAPYPEVNALDMLVFVRLSRSVVERHWLPEVFGERARPLANAFEDSEDRAWHLVGRVLDRERQHELASIIDAWEREHPEQIHVEMVRFTEFSARAGRIASEYQSKAAGLLGNVKQATLAVDRSVLLAERGMFLAHRLPTLMRLQARLGAQEVVSDSVVQLQDLEQELARASGHGHMLRELSDLSRTSLSAAQEARRTLEALKPIIDTLPPDAHLGKALTSTNELADKGLALLREAKALAPRDARGTAADIEAGVDRTMRRAVTYLALLGAVWALVFWGGYYLVRRALTTR